MAEMGKYCKAYLLRQLRGFHGWEESKEIVRKEKNVISGKATESTRPLADDDVVFVQENYVVTDGIFKDENIIFDRVTPEWITYCRETLDFGVPVDQTTSSEAAGQLP